MIFKMDLHHTTERHRHAAHMQADQARLEQESPLKVSVQDTLLATQSTATREVIGNKNTQLHRY